MNSNGSLSSSLRLERERLGIRFMEDSSRGLGLGLELGLVHLIRVRVRVT